MDTFKIEFSKTDFFKYGFFIIFFAAVLSWAMGWMALDSNQKQIDYYKFKSSSYLNIVHVVMRQSNKEVQFEFGEELNRINSYAVNVYGKVEGDVTNLTYTTATPNVLNDSTIKK